MFYRNFKFSGPYSGPYSTGRVLSERYNKVLRTLQERKTCVIQVKIQIDWLNMNSKPIAKRAWELVPLHRRKVSMVTCEEEGPVQAVTNGFQWRHIPNPVATLV